MIAIDPVIDPAPAELEQSTVVDCLEWHVSPSTTLVDWNYISAAESMNVE